MNKKKLIDSSRRNFLRLGAAGAGMVALSSISDRALPLGAHTAKAAPLPNHKRLVVINMLGGNDALNTVIPVNASVHSTYAGQRANIGFAQGQGLAINGVADYELHPELTDVQSMFNAGEVALINKIGYPNKNLSHFVSEDIWSRGVREKSVVHGVAEGWVARFANNYASTPMGVASIGVGSRLDFVGANVNPFLVASLSRFEFSTDWNYSKNHELRLTTIRNILAADNSTGDQAKVKSALDSAHSLSDQIQAAVTAYDTYATTNTIEYPLRTGSSTSLTNMGSRLRDVARLIHGGFDTRLFYTGIGGFDTHSDQLTRHASLWKEINDALGVFKTDLQTMGVWNDTVVVIISEFGRRNYENGSNGTDHGHGSSMMVLGGPVTGGVYGDDITVADLNENYMPYTTDFRDVYRAVIENHLGFSATPVFPETQPTNTTFTFV